MPSAVIDDEKNHAEHSVGVGWFDDIAGAAENEAARGVLQESIV